MHAGPRSLTALQLGSGTSDTPASCPPHPHGTAGTPSLSLRSPCSSTCGRRARVPRHRMLPCTLSTRWRLLYLPSYLPSLHLPRPVQASFAASPARPSLQASLKLAQRQRQQAQPLPPHRRCVKGPRWYSHCNESCPGQERPDRWAHSSCRRLQHTQQK